MIKTLPLSQDNGSDVNLTVLNGIKDLTHSCPITNSSALVDALCVSVSACSHFMPSL
jgi:hypothetical protein